MSDAARAVVAPGLPARRPLGWWALSALLAAGAVLLALLALVPQATQRWDAALDWQPSLAASQPWRWWSAALVHLSRWHLVANLAGLAVVALLGHIARLPLRCALAWALAWPLTQLGLLMRPDLLHYAGLSGVLHAGVAIAAWHLLRQADGGERLIGGLIGGGLLLKVLLETPWGAPLRHPTDWDIAIAPYAHASGVVAGLLCAIALDRPRPAR